MKQILFTVYACLMTKSLLALDPVTVATPQEGAGERPRVIVSTDIGGTDPDDFQSMIHYLMYADRFDTEGLISSPYGPGRKQDILRIIDLYEKDYPKLKAHVPSFPAAGKLRAVVKQGSAEQAPARGWSKPTEGSEWIIRQARSEDPRPLWVLVWGGLEDLAQALHDAPDIVPELRIYWIGGPNKKWSVNAYLYIVQNFPGLQMIEANATYRGWFAENNPEEGFGNRDFFERHIKGSGSLGREFINYYGGVIKMGDTPSVAYLLSGSAEKPDEPGWGGRFTPLPYSARRIFKRNTTLADSLPVYGVIEWIFEGPDVGFDQDEPCLQLEIDGQRFNGYYQGGGTYMARFVPKKTGCWKYRIVSKIEALNGQEGQFISVDPWPGKPHEDNIGGLTGWWSDDADPDLFLDGWQGAQTVTRWRRAWLMDWAERWSWLR